MLKTIWNIEKHLRRWFYSFDTPMRENLYKRKQRIAIKEKISDEERRELTKINVKLGNFARQPKLSKEQTQRQKEYAEKLIAEIIQRGG